MNFQSSYFDCLHAVVLLYECVARFPIRQRRELYFVGGWGMPGGSGKKPRPRSTGDISLWPHGLPTSPIQAVARGGLPVVETLLVDVADVADLDIRSFASE